MVRIAVYGNEKEIGQCVREFPVNQDEKYELSVFRSQEELLENAGEQDIILLKAERISGQSAETGISLAEEIRQQCEDDNKKQPILIFTADSAEYVFDAFDVDAFHYLVRPFSENKIRQVLRKAMDIVMKGSNSSQYLIIRADNHSYRIPSGTIYYIESENRKVRVVTGTESYTYYARLSDLEEQLRDSFFRIHKGYLVNLKYIREFDKTDITLMSGEHLPVSKYKYQNFLKAYSGHKKSTLSKERRGGKK